MSFPGYVFDERRQCYFRVPPKHFRRISHYEREERAAETAPPSVQTDRKLHTFLRERQTSVKSSAHSLRLLNEYLLPKLSENGILTLPLHCPEYENVTVDHSGELLAVKHTTDHVDSSYDVYHVQASNGGHFCQPLLSITGGYIGGFYSMVFVTDTSQQRHFICLCQDRVFEWKYNETSIAEPKMLHKSATCMTVCPDPNKWDTLYLAVGFHSGEIQAYDTEHQLFFRTTRIETSFISLASSSEDPLLFAGCRNGMCMLWDVRESVSPVTTISEPVVRRKIYSSIVGIHPLQDHNYVISNALNSNLSLWDLRMLRKVLVFSGHKNDYKTCKSIVDQLGSFVAAVGSDGKVNMWSIRTGELLQSINRTMSNGLPHIAFSEHLGGGSGEPSLLVTDGDDLVTYTVK